MYAHACLLALFAAPIVEGFVGLAAVQGSCQLHPFAKIVAGDGEANDGFGYAVAIDGETAVAGSQWDDDKGYWSGSAYVFRRTTSGWVQEAKLYATDPAMGDRFGVSVAVSGDTIVVGAHWSREQAGSAYVFRRTGPDWVQEAKLVASDGERIDYFGLSVAISGDIAVIGARWDDDHGTNSGSAYVFRRNGSVWTQESKIKASDGAPEDWFGCFVAIDRETIVVGASQDDDNGTNSGSAYVFQSTGSAWVQAAKLRAQDGAAGDTFGGPVAVSGEWILIGSPGDDDSGADSGSAYVFRRDGGHWLQTTKLKAADGAANSLFGASVALGGGMAMIGAPHQDAGAAYLFIYDGTQWVQTAQLSASDLAVEGCFGVSVAVSGHTGIVGAYWDDDMGDKSGSVCLFHGLSDCNLNGMVDGCDIANGTSTDVNANGMPDECDLGSCRAAERLKLLASDGAEGSVFGHGLAMSVNTAVIGALGSGEHGRMSGSAYVWRREGSRWVQEAKLLPSDGADWDWFGRRVAISGERIVVGASNHSHNGIESGSAYVFRRSGSHWIQEAELLASDGAPGDGFGRGVAIAGSTAVVGAPYRDDHGPESGAVYVFRHDGSQWTQTTKLLATDGGGNDSFGEAVAVYGDVILVGAYLDSDNGTYSGSVYVFRYDGAQWIQEAKLHPDDGAARDYFGYAIAFADGMALIGAYGVSQERGAAYVFRYDPISSRWKQEQKLVATDTGGGIHFGESVSLSGDIAVIGQGPAYLFRRTSAGWLQQARLSASDGVADDGFGIAVAVAGTTAIVGSLWDDNEQGYDAGAAYVFGSLADCDADGIPDLCAIATGEDPDCNANGIPDACDISDGYSGDCNQNGVPDECDVASGISKDCNANGAPDECDLASHRSKDCNGNNVPDECDIGDGTSEDFDRNGIPDECETTLSAVHPRMHPVQGGTAIAITGKGFRPGQRLRVNDVEVQKLTLIDWGRMSAIVPPNPVGVYDLQLEKASTGQVLTRLRGAIEYQDAQLPPPVGVEASHLGSQVQLTWALPVRYDCIQISGVSLNVTLPGGVTEYIVDVSAIPRGTPLTYRLSGSIGARTSYGTEVNAIWPEAEAPCHLAVTSSWFLPVELLFGEQRVALYGAGVRVSRTRFSVLQPMTADLRIRVRARCRQPGAALMARIRLADPPGTVVADAIAITDAPPSSSPEWCTGHYQGALEARRYWMEFYADGGDSNQVYYWVSEVHGHAAATVEVAQCGLRSPEILDIQQQLLYVPVDQPLAGIPLALRIIAHDPDGAVAQYAWSVRPHGTSNVVSQGIQDSNFVLATVADPGAYDVTVTVTDNDRRQVSRTVTLIASSSLEAPSTGEPPRIARPTPDPTGLAFVPDIDLPDVVQAFKVEIAPAAGAAISTVDMQMLHPVDRSVLMQQAAVPEDPLQLQTRWTAAFNMSDLPRLETAILRVSATDNKGKTRVLDGTIALCPIPCFAEQAFAERSIAYDPSGREYTLLLRFPKDPIYESSFHVPVIDVQLDNLLDARINTTLRMRDGRWAAGPLAGALDAELLSVDVLHKNWTVGRSNLDRYQCRCPACEIEYQLLNTPLHAPVSFNKRLFRDVTVATILGIQVSASLGVFGSYATSLAAALTLLRESPCAALDACVIPDATLGAEGSVKARALILTLEGTLIPSIRVQLPMRLRFIPPSTFEPTVKDCFTFDVDYRLRGCIDYWIDRSCKTIRGQLLNASFGEGCGQNPCGAGQLAAAERTASQDGEEVPWPFRSPCIAASPDGQTALMVYVDDRDPAIDSQKLDLFYRLDRGAGWSAAEPLWPPDEHTDHDPQMVFLDNGTAILVWTRNLLTHAQSASLPDSLTGQNLYLQHEEVYFAIWTSDGGWAAPQQLTTNVAADGIPKLVAVPGARQAWVAWIEFESPWTFFDWGDGERMNSYVTSIYARRLDPSGPVGPAVRITAGDDDDVAADFEPAIAWSPDANRGYLFFVREWPDSRGRHLMYSRCSGTAWSVPVQAFGGEAFPGVDMISTAMGEAGEGVVCFTTRLGHTVGSAAIGADEAVYAVRFVDEGTAVRFDAPVKLVLGASGDLGATDAGDAFVGRWPQVIHLGEGRFAMALRSHTTSAGFDADGEVGLATIDFRQPDPSWVLQNLTEDASTDIEIAVAPGGDGGVRLVRNRWATGPQDQGLLVEDAVISPELAVSIIEVSDPHALPGQIVRLAISLRNDGLRPATTGTAQETTLRAGIIENGQYRLLASVPMVFTALPGQEQREYLDIAMPANVNQVLVSVDPIPEEQNPSNNSGGILLGISPPADLRCSRPAESGSAMLLRWRNTDLYDAIVVLRDGTEIASLPGDALSFIDASGQPGSHVWTVRGCVGQARSDRQAARCENVMPGSPADFDNDGDVDAEDSIIFLSCVSGPARRHQGAAVCARADFDQDQDVDQVDFGTFQRCYAGAGQPSDPNCAR